MKIRNVTRGESYHFVGADQATVMYWWRRMGKDWRAVCAVSRWWARVSNQETPHKELTT